MKVDYAFHAIPEFEIPQAADPTFQHVLDTYASEVNKLVTTWLEFHDSDLSFRPHPKSATVLEIMHHELLSERRFFGEFLSMPEPPASEVLQSDSSARALADRLAEFAKPRLQFMAAQSKDWWLENRAFFDAERQRIWILWRRILHTAHHRTQLTVYLRFLDRAVPPIYGPTADKSWTGADPTHSVEAASRS